MWQPHDGVELNSAAHAANGQPDRNGQSPTASLQATGAQPGGLSTAGAVSSVVVVPALIFTVICVCGGRSCVAYLPLNFHARAAEAEQLLQVYGRNELEEKTTSKLIIFLKLVRPCCPLR